MSFTTIGVTQRAGPLIHEGDGPTMLVNRDQNNTIFLGDNLGITGGADTVALPPLASIVMNGETTVYGVTAIGLTASVLVIPGGLNFFQLVELIIKTLIINASVGNGLFVYNGTGALGNPPILSVVGPGTTTDPFGNAVKAVMNIGSFNGSHIGWDANGNTYVSGPDGKTRVFIANGSIPTGPNNNMDPAIWFFNDFGATILVVDPSAGGVYQYQDNNSATQGGLVFAGISKNASDPVSLQPENAGMNIIDPVFGDSTRVTGSIIVINSLNWANPAQISASGGAPSGAVGPSLNFFGPLSTKPDYANMALFGESPDATIDSGLVIARATSQAQAVKNTSELLEVQGTIVITKGIPFTPGSTSTEETWHTVPGLAGNGWSVVAGEPVYSYRINLDGEVEIVGSATHTSITAVTALSTALPAAYRPSTTQYIAPGQTGQCGLQILTTGIINAVPPASGSGTARCNGSYPLNL